MHNKIGFPSPAHIMQSIQTRSTSSNDNSHRPVHNFIVDDLCYTLCFGPEQTRDPRWVPAVIIQRTDTRNIQVRTFPQDSIWRRHIDQLPLRYSWTKDDEPREDCSFETDNTPNSEQNNNAPGSSTQNESESSVQESMNTLPHLPVYGPFNTRRSKKALKQRRFYGTPLTDY